MTTDSIDRFNALERRLIAILRGIKPEETAGIIRALVDAGIRAIEIPLNSADAMRSISIARDAAPDDCIIGAGTVLEAREVDELQKAGGELVVSPNVDPSVIMRTKELGMISMPGVFTASEALLAVRSGADALKFFPANLLGPEGINAIRAVLPAGMACGAVGGVGNDSFAKYVNAGITLFGTGSSLYKPGLDAATIGQKAVVCVGAYEAAMVSVKGGRH